MSVSHSGKFYWVLRNPGLEPVASSQILDYSMDNFQFESPSGLPSILDSITTTNFNNIINGTTILDIYILDQHHSIAGTGSTNSYDNTYIYTVELNAAGLSNDADNNPLTLFIGKPCGQVLHCSGDILQLPSGTWINTSGLNPELASHIDETIPGYNNHPSGNWCMFDYNRIYQSGNITLPEFLFTNDGASIKIWDIQSSGLIKTITPGVTSRLIAAEPVYKYICFESGSNIGMINYSGTHIQTSQNLVFNIDAIAYDSQRSSIVVLRASGVSNPSGISSVYGLFGNDTIVGNPISGEYNLNNRPLMGYFVPKLNRWYYTVASGNKINLWSQDRAYATNNLIYTDTDINRFVFSDITNTFYYGKNNSNNIFKQPFGGAETTLITNSTTYDKPVDFAVDSARNRLFWSNVSGYIYHSTLSGTDITQFCYPSGITPPYLALDCQNGGITFQSKAQFQLEDVASGIGYTDSQQFSMAWTTVAYEISDHPGNASGNISISGVVDVFKSQIVMPDSGYIWESQFLTDKNERYFRNVPYNKQYYYQTSPSSGIVHIGGQRYDRNVPLAPYYSKIYPENNSWTAWNSGILELEVTSFNLPYNSGNSKIHTVEVVGNHCIWPNFGQLITNALTMYIQGPLTTNSGIDLYISGIYADSSGLDLYIYGVGNPISGDLTFVTSGVRSHVDNLPLFIQQDGRSISGNMPFYLYSTTGGSGNYLTFPLFIGANVNTNFPLFISANASGLYGDGLPLYISTVEPVYKSLDLYLHNTNVGYNSGLELFLLGQDGILYDGISLTGSFPLFIARDSEGDSFWHPLFMLGPSGINDNFTMCISGANIVTSGFDMYISGIGIDTKSFKMFSHGF